MPQLCPCPIQGSPLFATSYFASTTLISQLPHFPRTFPHDLQSKIQAPCWILLTGASINLPLPAPLAPISPRSHPPTHLPILQPFGAPCPHEMGLLSLFLVLGLCGCCSLGLECSPSSAVSGILLFVLQNSVQVSALGSNLPQCHLECLVHGGHSVELCWTDRWMAA